MTWAKTPLERSSVNKSKAEIFTSFILIFERQIVLIRPVGGYRV